MIDNINRLLGDDLKAELADGGRLRIAAATFSIFAFEALREELEQLDELQFIFTSPSFVASEAADGARKEHREFFIPRTGRPETSLTGSEFEIRLRNKLTQKAIARECANWLRRKASFRSNTSDATMQQFAVVNESAVYAPINGFTSADLGYERTNALSNMVNKLNLAPITSQYLSVFDQIWNNSEGVQDVTDAVHDHIAAVYAENAPAHIYFLVLHHLFADFLEDLNEDVLPNDLTGYEETDIWRGLYNFQRDAARGAINKLETFNGCILADSVGLGKTFTALAVIKYYELRNKSVLVLAPKKLADNWTNFNANLTTNPFARDRFNYDVLAHTDLSRHSGESLGIPLDRVNWGNYDLLVIDESHNFRNNHEAPDHETRYGRLMREVIRQGVKTKVLMLSATPVNNRFADLRNQLALAYEGESTKLATKLDLSRDIEEIFRQAQGAFNAWSKLPPRERTTESLLGDLDFDFFELLDAVTIARSRTHIEAFYDTSEIGQFPERRRPISLRPPLSDLGSLPSFNDIFEQLSGLTLAVYAPLGYVFESKIAKYEELYGTEGQGSLANLGHRSREHGLQSLMTTNLLKRLESSVEAFRITLAKLGAAIDRTLAQLDESTVTERDVAAFDDLDAEDDGSVDEATLGGKVPIALADMDTASFRQDLTQDKATIDQLLMAMRKVTPAHDSKLQELRARVVAKSRHPFNEGNCKVLIFSAFADTADYLYRELAPLLRELGMASAVVTGGSTPRTTLGRGLSFQQVLTLFSPRSKLRDTIMPNDGREIDVLIATDVISEGQNLQDCDFVINYDIHWNPVRIIQRFGRIDRIGSINKSIQMVNFWPDMTLDDYINLKERVENRMVIADLSATADDNPLTQRASSASFRHDQLRRLQDEVIDLEDVRSGVSVTDLGLNDFRMDLLDYTEQHGDLDIAPRGLHAVAPARPEAGLRPGVIFALRNVHADPTINRGNRLHPHYLVYLGDDGEVIVDHTQVKQLLDLLRSGSRRFESPVQEVCRIFNDATADGAEMGHYSKLLNDAITSMTEVTDEQDVASLFTAGPTTALRQTINGLDDFELIAFLAIVEPSSVEETGT